MEVHLPPDKEARLRQLATRTGKEAEQVVEEAVDRMLEYEARFIEAVEQGRVSARRGDLLEHDEVVERIEQMFRALTRVRWTTAAADDLVRIVERIRGDNPGASLHVARTIYKAVAELRRFPHRGRTGLAPGTRELVFP